MNNNQVTTAALLLALMFSGASSLAIADSSTSRNNGHSKQRITAQEILGNVLFEDTNLSEPDGQSCASCHDRDAGQADPDQDLPVSEGATEGKFTARITPPTGYAMYNPVFQYDSEEGLWLGGQLWDGRATGNILGDPLADQALKPFLGDNEMGNPGKLTVVRDASQSRYRRLFEYVCGVVDLEDPLQVEEAYDCIALSIGSFERTRQFGQFSSKYDRYLYNCIWRGDASDQALDDCAKGRGKDALKAARKVFSWNEWAGMQLFMGEQNNNDGILQDGEGAVCAACHTADWSNESDYALKVQVPRWAPAGKVPPLFTDFTYDNVGIPKSTHPLLADKDIDLGLGGREDFLEPAEEGKFKVTSLRNVADTAPYGHNGFFDSLRAITRFYNTRDVEDWGDAEVPQNMNTDEMGNLGLSKKQEKQIVRFMRTLSD